MTPLKIRRARPSPPPDPLRTMVTALRRIRDHVQDNPDADAELRHMAREILEAPGLGALERQLAKRRTPNLRIRRWRPGDPEPAP